MNERRMIENSDRGITLNKQLAWTIGVGLICAGLYVGLTIATLSTQMEQSRAAWAEAGTALRLPRGWTCTKTGTGVYVITHNLLLGADTHAVTATPSGTPGRGYCSGMVLSGNSFEIYFANTAGAAADMDFNFTLTVI